MKRQAYKTQESLSSINPRVMYESHNLGTIQVMDNRASTIYQRKLQEKMNDSTANIINPIQRRSNKTGLPDKLKLGIENLSGYSMDDVKVHYNSNKPAQLQAHAYAQGTDIHLAPGQEKQLPHEAWHVVQQKQGRVKPTRQLKSKVNINDDAELEKEADVMGYKALGFSLNSREESAQLKAESVSNDYTIQRRKIKSKGLTVAGEFHTKPKEQRRKEIEFVKYVKGPTAQVWTENKMPGSKTDTSEASELPEHLLLSGIDRIKYYSTMLIAELSRNNTQTMASHISMKISVRAIEDAFGTISGDLRNALSGIEKSGKNDPFLGLQELKRHEFFMTIITSNIGRLEGTEKEEFIKTHPDFLEDLEKFNQLVSSMVAVPEDRNVSHNFVRSKKMNDIANEKKDANGVWLIGQYHVQEIQEQLRGNVHYELLSMNEFNDAMREYLGNKDGGKLVGRLSSKMGEVSASARIIKSSLKFFEYLNDKWDSIRYDQVAEQIDFEVERLIKHTKMLCEIDKKDLEEIELPMDEEEKTKIIEDILKVLKIVKKDLVRVPFLNFVNEYLPNQNKPNFLSLILDSLSKKNFQDLVSDLEKLGSVAK